MAYQSVDRLQNLLADQVFGYAKDKKKASGRALGTLVEIVTYYTLCAWGLREYTAIEEPVPEFGHPAITHNVEFSLHPKVASQEVALNPKRLPVTPAKISKEVGGLAEWSETNHALLSSDLVMRNASLVARAPGKMLIGNIDHWDGSTCRLTLDTLLSEPWAIFECKRVGVEEGQSKGPQTIEKAKQGAYVARTVSSLQKIRLADGSMQGVVDRGGGVLHAAPYESLIREIIDQNDPDLLRHFMLTVGVVSNHGNWFTAEDHNKELRVLAQSYDWLLFLTDIGLTQFIERLLIQPQPELQPARAAFLASYPKTRGTSQFTKRTMGFEADGALKRYFEEHESEVEGWFNVIAPNGRAIADLRNDLVTLAGKSWEGIRR